MRRNERANSLEDWFGKRRAEYRDLSDARLIEAMRGDDRCAWAEYFSRFYSPLEDYLKQARVPSGDWEPLIMEVLSDAAVEFTRKRKLPKRMLQHLVIRVKHKFLNHVRSADRRESHYEAALPPDTHDRESVVASTLSFYTLTSVKGVDEEPEVGTHARARANLARALARHLDERELDVMGMVGSEIEKTQIAAWLRMQSYGQLVQWIRRIQLRLWREAPGAAAVLSVPEREVAERLLKRIADDAALKQQETAMRRRRSRPPPVAPRDAAGEHGGDAA